MAKINDISMIVFDCDGVLLESVAVKTKAFGQTVAEYGQKAVDRLIEYHLAHGGVSRYKKFEWFYQEILGKKITDEELEILGDRFKQLSFEGVMNAPMVEGADKVLEVFYNKIPMFVASGAPHEELIQVLKAKEMFGYFRGVFGSPPAKTQLLQQIIDTCKVLPERVLMVGDSSTDLEAAENCGTLYFGRGETFKSSGWPCSKDLNGLLSYLSKHPLIS